MPDEPQIFGLPPGVDFAGELVRGLDQRYPDLAPEVWAAAEIYANSPRMARLIRAAFEDGPPRVIPRLRLVTDIDDPALPPAIPPLRRRLDLARLVAAYLAAEEGVAPRESAFALADGLAGLFAEMQDEGLAPGTIAGLDVSDQSGHWARALQFIAIAEGYAGAAGEGSDPEGRRRLALIRRIAAWADAPPAYPVIVAGSTGSRGTTALLAAAVARLPMGAVVLPGFDFDMTAAAWDSLSDARAAEDHPQYRFRRLAETLGIAPQDISRWTDAQAPASERNRLISLSLRPAPVTDCWIAEGPDLGDLGQAIRGLTLVEAATPRAEAEAIALRLRAALAEGRTAALISPDRMLTRQVAAALDRWNITPDDSAGTPLALSPPGRLLRQVAALRADRISGADLIAALKHPLAHSAEGRGDHLLATHALELRLRRDGPPYPTGRAIRDIAQDGWHAWLGDLLDALPAPDDLPLSDHVAAHLMLATRLAGGPEGGAGGLWDEAAGRAARTLTDDLTRHADAGGEMSARDYAALFEDLIATGPEVRDQSAVDPRIRILGPREARECVADLVILGGLNDGTWPAAPAPDPWLNRAMRLRAGLLLPERQIGLSAHDYQQAAAAPEIWLCRALKSDSAETVPARWLSRLTNLLAGLPDQGGRAALDHARAEGARWIAAAAGLSEPLADVPRAPRPSPAPPLDKRPERLSVTAVERLLRDPYAIYADRILRLRPLDPLTAAPDAPLRGTILHDVLDRALRGGLDPQAPDAAQRLIAIAEQVMEAECPWPMMRRLWLARLARVADWFIAGEAERQALGRPVLAEERGAVTVADTGVTLTAQPDRIDLTPDGRAILYDYKTGNPPTENQIKAFSKQLLLEAAMVERGAFAGLGARPAAGAQYIGLGSPPKIVTASLEDNPPDEVWADLIRLLRAWADRTRGYTARMAMMTEGHEGAYDHLSRFGEWEAADPAERLILE